MAAETTPYVLKMLDGEVKKVGPYPYATQGQFIDFYQAGDGGDSNIAVRVRAEMVDQIELLRARDRVMAR